MKKIHEIADIQKHFDELYEQIINSEFKTIDEIENINGIYVFYERGKAQYVGRTNKGRMKERIKEHSMPYSNQNSASFAFRIAKEKMNRPDLKKIETRDENFISAKERVRKMKIKVIIINDRVVQTMFEAYLAFKLNTIRKYNDFMTH